MNNFSKLIHTLMCRYNKFPKACFLIKNNRSKRILQESSDNSCKLGYSLIIALRNYLRKRVGVRSHYINDIQRNVVDTVRLPVQPGLFGFQVSNPISVHLTWHPIVGWNSAPAPSYQY